jgi:hypothetical protein
MRLLVLILLLLNVALFAYRDYAAQSSGAQSPALMQQVRPQRIKLLSAQEFAQLSAPRNSVEVCLQIGPLGDADLARTKANILALQPNAALNERRAEGVTYLEIRQANENLRAKLSTLAAGIPSASTGACPGS